MIDIRKSLKRYNQFLESKIVSAEFSHLENQVIGLRRLKYVHELQNLFFALVREELKTT